MKIVSQVAPEADVKKFAEHIGATALRPYLYSVDCDRLTELPDLKFHVDSTVMVDET
jgi:hypothetical protein